MRHPIITRTGYKPYALTWIIIMLVHTAVLYFNFNFHFYTALVDGVIFNFTFGAMGMGLWYVVSFATINKDGLSFLSTHIVAALTTITLWVSLSNFILQLVLPYQAYNTLPTNAIVWKVITGLMYYSIIILAFYQIKYYRESRDRTNRELELQTLLKEAELRMLKSQINPHFIFNSLNSISALTITQPEGVQQMIIKLSDFLRYSLGKSHTEMNSLKDEIGNISLYLDIEKIRFGDRLNFEKMIAVDCEKIEVPNLILQPLFENAIKYGVYDTLNEVIIKLSCELEGDFLHVAITNSYDSEAVPSKGTGIGLESVRKRLLLVYGNSDLLTVSKNTNEFNVSLKIPTNFLK